MGETKPPLITVIIPTCGRETLQDTLVSVRSQFDYRYEKYEADRVELLVVADTHRGTFGNQLKGVPEMCKEYYAQYIEHDGGMHCWGHPQRNYGQSIARGEWIIWIQDDDVYSDCAFRSLLRVAKTSENQSGFWGVILSQTLTWQAGVVWREKELWEGNIDANCIFAPNIPERLGKWTDRYNGDFDFIRDTCEKWNNKILWFPRVIAVGRPQRFDNKSLPEIVRSAG